MAPGGPTSNPAAAGTNAGSNARAPGSAAGAAGGPADDLLWSEDEVFHVVDLIRESVDEPLGKGGGVIQFYHEIGRHSAAKFDTVPQRGQWAIPKQRAEHAAAAAADSDDSDDGGSAGGDDAEGNERTLMLPGGPGDALEMVTVEEPNDNPMDSDDDLDAAQDAAEEEAEHGGAFDDGARAFKESTSGFAKLTPVDLLEFPTGTPYTHCLLLESIKEKLEGRTDDMYVPLLVDIGLFWDIFLHARRILPNCVPVFGQFHVGITAYTSLWDHNQWILAPLTRYLFGTNANDIVYKPKQVAQTMNMLNMLNIAYRDGTRDELKGALERVHWGFPDYDDPRRQSAQAQLRVLATFMETEVPLVRETMFQLENADANPGEAFDTMRTKILPLLCVFFQHRGNRNYAEGVATWLMLMYRMEQQGHPCFEYMRENYQFFNERAIELLHKFLASESARVELRHEYDLLRKNLQMFPVFREVKDFVEYEFGLERAEASRVVCTSVKYRAEIAKTKEFLSQLIKDAQLGVELQKVATGKKAPHPSFMWSASPGIGTFTFENTLSPPPNVISEEPFAEKVRTMLDKLHGKLVSRLPPPAVPPDIPTGIKRRATGESVVSGKGEKRSLEGGKSAWYSRSLAAAIKF